MRCLTCKYDLSQLAEHRCPECGRAFDPRDASTFTTPPDRIGRYREGIKFAAAFAVCAGIAAIVVQQSTSRVAGKDLPLLLILFLGWCAVVVIASFALLRFGPKS